MSSFHHISVLLNESVDALNPMDGGVYVDCTLGGGGHTRALLDAADTRVIGFDRDPQALQAATERLREYGDRFIPVRTSFCDLTEALDNIGVQQVHGVLADLGVSSHQLDTADRGFSFRHDGPIDMRMDPDAELSAADVVNSWSEVDLASAIYTYGEERRSRRIAKLIVGGRPWKSTVQLADAIAAISPRGKSRIHPATRTFQAIRIAVNQELDQLERLLPAATERLLPHGRLAIITFHSLEDRITKRFFARESGKGLPRDPYGNPIGTIRLRSLRPQTPRQDDPNPRARSARLRVAERLP